MTNFNALALTDPNGVTRYFRAEGSTSDQNDPSVVAHDPFTRDCDSVAVALSASGDVIAAVGSRKIRVLALIISADAACNITLQSGASTDIFGPIYLAANSSTSFECNTGLFETVVSERLNAVLSGTANYSVSVRYREI